MYLFICAGVPGQIRTAGTRIRNPVLYPSELQGHTEQIVAKLIKVVKAKIDPGKM